MLVWTDEQPLTPRERITSRYLAGRAVLLDLDTGGLHTLNESGTAVWHLLEERPQTVAEVVITLHDVTGEPEARLRADVCALAGALAEADLLQPG